MQLKPIAKIYTAFPEKFGIPRQSGLVKTVGKIVFEKEYQNPTALRGLEDFSHIWLIWGFSLNDKKEFSPTVRPPRLGGNKRMGVFATRSPFRPNPIGLSCVKIEKIVSEEENGMVIYVEGADLADKTPIYDIKPYLAYTDSHPDALGGFADDKLSYKLSVTTLCPTDGISEKELSLIHEIIQNDPRPSYQDDADRVYKFSALGYDIEFSVKGKTASLKKISRI